MHDKSWGGVQMKGCSKVLVTGEVGFIGSHLVDALMSRDFFVRPGMSLKGGKLKSFDGHVFW